MINNQKKEKPFSDPDGKLQIHSIFRTIQGEGPYSGVPAIFIRLSGCNLQCPWCDTEYTGEKVETLTPVFVLSKVRELAWSIEPIKLVVITGGEPFRQDFSKLVMLLHSAGYTIQIETNGTIAQEVFPYHLTTIVCSPKTGHIDKRLIPYIRHYKYVAEYDKICLEDGLPIEVLGNKVRKFVARPPKNIPHTIYLQPMDSQDKKENERNLQAVVAACQTYGHTLCLQIHKIIGVE